jgi:hypothetical protein
MVRFIAERDFPRLHTSFWVGWRRRRQSAGSLRRADRGSLTTSLYSPSALLAQSPTKRHTDSRLTVLQGAPQHCSTHSLESIANARCPGVLLCSSTVAAATALLRACRGNQSHSDTWSCLGAGPSSLDGGWKTIKDLHVEASKVSIGPFPLISQTPLDAQQTEFGRASDSARSCSECCSEFFRSVHCRARAGVLAKCTCTKQR